MRLQPARLPLRSLLLQIRDFLFQPVCFRPVPGRSRLFSRSNVVGCRRDIWAATHALSIGLGGGGSDGCFYSTAAGGEYIKR